MTKSKEQVLTLAVDLSLNSQRSQRYFMYFYKHFFYKRITHRPQGISFLLKSTPR